MIAANIADYIQTQNTLIEQELDRLIPARPGPSEKLFEAARYVILGEEKGFDLSSRLPLYIALKAILRFP